MIDIVTPNHISLTLADHGHILQILRKIGDISLFSLTVIRYATQYDFKDNKITQISKQSKLR